MLLPHGDVLVFFAAVAMRGEGLRRYVDRSIVKLCGHIAVLMLKQIKDKIMQEGGQVTVHSMKCAESLDKASKLMSNLESCMLFADCGAKRTNSPLLSEVAKKALKLVGN